MFNLFKFFFYLIKYRSIILGRVSLGHNVWIRYSYIRGNVKLGDFSSVFRSNIVGNISIGSYSSITGPFTYLQSNQSTISIGDRSAIGPGTLAITVSHDRSIVQKSVSSGGRLTEEDIILGNDVWLGAGTRLLSGSIINDNVTIGAGAVVLKGVYSSDSLYVGVPAKLKRYG